MEKSYYQYTSDTHGEVTLPDSLVSFRDTAIGRLPLPDVPHSVDTILFGLEQKKGLLAFVDAQEKVISDNVAIYVYFQNDLVVALSTPDFWAFPRDGKGNEL